MNWRFWEAKRKQDELMSPVIIGEHLANIICQLDNLEVCFKNSQQQVYKIDERLVQNADQLMENTVQLQKLARLHYKKGQETHTKLDRIITNMGEIQHWQEQCLLKTNQLQLKEKQITLLAKAIIKQLDDLDYIRQSLKNDARNKWWQMLEQWALALVQALAEVGIMEMDLYGKSFNPRQAEAIATITKAEAIKMCPNSKENALLPYQVMAIIRRGFVTSEGHILRKAQVITIQEEDNNG